MVSERALQGLFAQIEAARAAGATIVRGAHRLNRPDFFLEPTIITDFGPDNPLYQSSTPRM